jgi:hypothetical protein
VRRRRLGAALIVVTAITAVSLPARGADPDTSAPNGRDQATSDGCQRNAVGLLTFTSPEWVFIRKDQTTHFVEGTVLEDSSHPAPGGGDLPEGHEWYDFNGDIAITDPALAYQAGINNDTGKTFDSLHTERESGQVPVAAWMTADDRAAVWGSWIWDCGHWGPGLDFSKPDDEANRDYVMPGQGELPGDTGKDLGNGETAEFHPVKAYAITRTNPYYSPVEQTETDFYVSNYGTTAHAEEVCARNSTPVGPAMGPDYTQCLQNPLNRHWVINDSDYSFFIPAPPKPAGVANPTLRVQMKTNDGEVGPQPTPVIDVRADGVQVTIPYKTQHMDDVPAVPQCPVAADHPEHAVLPPYDCPSQATSRAFFVGWEGGEQHLPAEIELTLDSVTVHRSLDVPAFETSAQQPPGEYGINMDVNGLWAYINDYAPGLDHVYGDKDPGGAGQGGPMPILDKDGKPAAFHIYVKDGGRIRMFFPTRECDLPHMNPCFVTSEVAEDNDGPGDAKLVYKSVDEAVGQHVIKGGGTADDPNWELAYTIKKIASARVAPATEAGSPGGPVTGPSATTYPNAGSPGDAAPESGGGVLGQRATCSDTFTPRSRFRGPNRRDSHHSPLRAGRRGLSLRGRAVDADCRGKRGPVARVEVAIARISGKRCRYLDSKGQFTAPASCSVPRGFLRARGTSSWRFSKRLKLAPGRYRAFSRAVDPAGNTEYGAHTGNRARFSVR